jgi:hypothetical protein
MRWFANSILLLLPLISACASAAKPHADQAISPPGPTSVNLDTNFSITIPPLFGPGDAYTTFQGELTITANAEEIRSQPPRSKCAAKIAMVVHSVQDPHLVTTINSTIMTESDGLPGDVAFSAMARLFKLLDTSSSEDINIPADSRPTTRP